MSNKFFTKANPFKVLGLPTKATKTEVVEHTNVLSDLAETDEERILYREAVQEVLTHPDTRLQYELFEIPDARYEDEDTALNTFVSTPPLEVRDVIFG